MRTSGKEPVAKGALLASEGWHRFVSSLCLLAFVALPVAPISATAADDDVHPIEQPTGTKSENLRRDLKKMWATERLSNSEGFASTNAAIAAADRVFNTVSLVGKTRKEVSALLGDSQKSNNSKYNFPFWPAPKDAVVYRFDCGQYGWQFNVLFDSLGKVEKVERRWIH